MFITFGGYHCSATTGCETIERGTQDAVHNGCPGERKDPERELDDRHSDQVRNTDAFRPRSGVVSKIGHRSAPFGSGRKAMLKAWRRRCKAFKGNMMAFFNQINRKKRRFLNSRRKYRS